MGRLVLVVFILAEILVLQAMADKSEVNASGVKSQIVCEPTGLVTETEIADPPSSGDSEPSDESKGAAEAQAPSYRRMHKHHSSDKSVAGGGVIIGGLVTAIFAAVFCYIRVTRRSTSDQS